MRGEDGKVYIRSDALLGQGGRCSGSTMTYFGNGLLRVVMTILEVFDALLVRGSLKEDDFDDFLFYYLYYGRAMVRTGKKDPLPDNSGLSTLARERTKREARTPETDLIVRRNWLNTRISSTILKYHDINKLMSAGCDHPIREHSVFGIRPKVVEVFRNGEVFEFHAIM